MLSLSAQLKRNQLLRRRSVFDTDPKAFTDA